MATWWAGSLWVAMAVHAAYDIAAGLHYERLGRELGFPGRQPALEPADAGP